MFKQLAAEIAAVEGELEAVEAAIVALRPRLEESTARAADPFDDEARDASRVQGDPGQSSVIRLNPPLPLVGVSTPMERERRQNGSLANC